MSCFRAEAHDFELHTHYILVCLEKIENLVRGRPRDDFMRSEECVNAVCVQIEIVHSFIKTIPEQFKQKYPSIPWESIPSMTSKPLAVPYNSLAWTLAGDAAASLKRALLHVREQLLAAQKTSGTVTPRE